MSVMDMNRLALIKSLAEKQKRKAVKTWRFMPPS